MKIQSKPFLDGGCDYFISGHYHQAKELDMKNGKLLILGDWLSFFSYGKFDGNDLRLHFWKKDEKKYQKYFKKLIEDRTSDSLRSNEQQEVSSGK